MPFGAFLLQSRQANSLVPSSCAFTFPPSRKGGGNGDSYEKNNFPGPCHEFRLGDECRTSGRDRRESRLGGRCGDRETNNPRHSGLVAWRVRSGTEAGVAGTVRAGVADWRDEDGFPLRPSARLQPLPAPITITTGPIMVQVRTITAPVPIMAPAARARARASAAPLK